MNAAYMRARRYKGRSRLHRLFAPNTYLLFLFAIYGLAFIDNPLGWHNSIPIDFRYLHIHLVFAVSFVLAQHLGKRLGRGTAAVETMRGQSRSRYYLVLAFALSCLLATAAKAGGLAIFTDNANLFRRDFVTLLGGFVSYPIFLLTPLAVVAILQFRRARAWSWLLVYCIASGLQLAQLNRQEFLICLVAPIMVAGFDKEISVVKLSIYLTAAAALIYVLGVLSIQRIGGAELISKTVPAEELPFWVVLSDLTGTVRLGHSIVDAVGSAGLGTYVWGVFISIFVPQYTESSPHGAQAIRLLFTDADTAQSIPAPLSYYADGGLGMVVLLALVQGVIIGFLWRKARGGGEFSRLIYVMNFLFLLWTIRSGTVSFAPIFLLEFAALAFIYGRQVKWAGLPSLFPRSARAAFVVVMPVCLLALAVRY